MADRACDCERPALTITSLILHFPEIIFPPVNFRLLAGIKALKIVSGKQTGPDCADKYFIKAQYQVTSVKQDLLGRG